MWLGARTASVLEDPRKDPRPSNGKLLPPWLPPELGITDEDEAEAVAQLDARGRRVLAQNTAAVGSDARAAARCRIARNVTCSHADWQCPLVTDARLLY